jgi:23S rRNA pseudouridine1911/1915/1917 synthase
VVIALVVPNELEGQRLDRFVEWRIPRLTRERAAEIVRACGYRADGTRRAPSDRVRAGETVLLVRERFVEPETPRTFGVIWQDDAVTVIDKPPGLPVHPSATYHHNTLTSLMRLRWGQDAPHICHRLDRETSGVVVCAIPGPDEVVIKRQFEQRSVAKEYLAIATGSLADDGGVIDLPLRRATSGLHMRMEPHPEGLPARTEYRVLERRGDRSLVHLVPLTGRQHQLRVHLAAIGHPIVGDKLYGEGGDELFMEIVESGISDASIARLGHRRHALHAFRCTIEHPRTGARITFEAPLAPDLVALWEGGEPRPGEP